MYLIVIGWLYVVLMMALTAKSFAAGLSVFLGWGLAPAALFLWFLGRRLRKVTHQRIRPQDGRHTEGDQ